MQDPAFQPDTLGDVTQPAHFEWVGSAQQDALEDTDGNVDQQGTPIDCQYTSQIVPRVYSTGTWYMPLFAGVVETADVRTAMDAIIATQPTVEYFTLEPFTSLEASNALNACGDRDTAVYGGAIPDPDVPPPSWTQVQGEFGNGTDEPQRFEVDAAAVDIAVKLGSDWFVAPAWGALATDYPGAPGVYLDDGGLALNSRWGQLGSSSGRPAYLLRDTAHTWLGQDAGNTANRIFWTTADVAGSATHYIAGQWGHLHGGVFMKIRGWVLVEAPRWMCVL